MKPIFEVCLQSPADALQAQLGGADRVELCAALVEGGITPDYATVRQCIETVDLPVMVMVRPRGGDFCYSGAELDVMEANVSAIREMGAAGVVFGVLNYDGSIARPQVQRLVKAAGGLEVTFHRAFDVCRSPGEALEELIDLGAHRILTSGTEATAPEGAETITDLITAAAGRIKILPGSGLTPENIRRFLRITGATEYHATAFETTESKMTYRNEKIYMGTPGLPEYQRQITTATEVGRFVEAATLR